MKTPRSMAVAVFAFLTASAVAQPAAGTTKPVATFTGHTTEDTREG
jgi:hypothetical protein